MARVPSIAKVFFQFAKRRWICFSRWVPADITPQELGGYGELIAAQELGRRGYKCLYRNFRAPHGGEVDIVCRHGSVLVFAEVKTRRTATFGEPVEAVTLSKQGLIERGALAWLRLLENPEISFRFDVVEVQANSGRFEVNVIQDAFTLSEHYRY